MKKHYQRSALFLACTTSLLPLGSHGDETRGEFAGAQFLEEIVITAQKRESAVSETPIAITAMSSDQLRSLGVQSSQDLANLTPSMSFSGQGNGRVYLRGVGRETDVLGTEPGVGVYDNGFYDDSLASASESRDRIERVEVLRGPQGTLFGRNTTGGAVNVHAKKPGEEYEHIARFTMGNYQFHSTELTSSGPINDKVGYFVHYTYSDRDSYFDNVAGEDPIGQQNAFFETQLDFDISDNINWNIRYYSIDYKVESLRPSILDAYQSGAGAPSKLNRIQLNPELFANPSTNPTVSDSFKISSDLQGSNKYDDHRRYQSILTLNFDGFDIRMLNGYESYFYDSISDQDRSAPIETIRSVTQDKSTQQHEVQFISNNDSDVQWVLGLFHFNEQQDQPFAILEPNNPYLSSLTPEGTAYFQQGIYDATSEAVYGQVDWNVNDSLILSAGLRYSEDHKEGTEYQKVYYDSVVDFCGGEAATPALVARGNPYADIGADFGTPCRFARQIVDGSDTHDESWNAVNWRLNASYFVGEESMIYATVATGYKPGGFRLGGLQDDPTTPENESIVENEELISYEFGYKGQLSDTISLTAAAFYYEYTDLQVEVSILDPASGVRNLQLINAPKSEIYGLELETTWAATDNLTLIANYSYLESEYMEDFLVVDTKTNLERNVKGNRLSRSPKNKFFLAANYAHNLDNGSLVVTGSYSYVDDQFSTVFNDDIETLDSYSSVNARVTWYPSSEKYELSLYGKNLSDEISYVDQYEVSDLADGVRRAGMPIAPRTFGLEVAFFL